MPNLLLLFRNFRHGGFSEQQHTCDGYRILKRNADDLGWIDNSRLHEVDILLASRVEAVVALPLQHAGDHDTAIDGGILGDLPRRRF